MGFCPRPEFLQRIMAMLAGKNGRSKPADQEIGAGKKLEGTLVLRKKNLLDFGDPKASFLDCIHEFLGKGVSIILISADNPHPVDGLSENIGKIAHLEKWMSTRTPPKETPPKAEDTSFPIAFEWDEKMGFPGAFLIKNNHHSQFYLKTLTLDNVPGYGQVHFVCNSWVYPARYYGYDRIFFANKSYLPSQTPEPLIKYREKELVNLQGNGSGMRKEWDRVYDYAYYNDLGNPDKGEEHARPVLGGSEEFPYPRRVRTGRKPSKTDMNTESRLPLLSLNTYIPRDERFGPVKFSDFLAYGLKSIVQTLVPELSSICDKTFNEFDSLEDVMNLYEGDIRLPDTMLAKIRNRIPGEFFKEIFRTDGEKFLKLPLPDVIKESKTAWRTDEEFGREMLAGLNPVCIRRLQEFPPASNLDSTVFGNQESSIRAEHIEKYLNGLTVHQAIEAKKMFILDHHDVIMPYLKRINSTATKTYASRTLLLLQDDGTLKPLAIELSLPHPQGDHHGAFSKVFMPAEHGVEGSVWQLAKAYVAVNDSGYHQLISHWLHTHATMEPFVIATNRQLSVLHPINKLLHPHFKDTMNVNALARQILINADGVLEKTVFPSKFALEMSSHIYKKWVFTDQALPADLLKRGVAEPDLSCASKVKLVIEDYPYAVDGLEIWAAIETWVEEYSSVYYKTDEQIQADPELQSWWNEIRTMGHGDKKHEPWWVPMRTRAELIESCTTIIWVASALHAAINFGQYMYGGYLPNRPTVSRTFMPEPGTKEYADLEANPDLAFLKTITPQFQAILGVSLVESLSRHASDEIYLGQRESPNWSGDREALEAFERFGKRLGEIEERITERNKDEKLKNRAGPVNVPYTLLYPNASDFSGACGLTGKGIPNSVSI